MFLLICGKIGFDLWNMVDEVVRSQGWLSSCFDKHICWSAFWNLKLNPYAIELQTHITCMENPSWVPQVKTEQGCIGFFSFYLFVCFFPPSVVSWVVRVEAAFSLNLLVPLIAGIPSSVSSLYRIFSLSISRSNSWSKKKGIPQFLMQSKLIDKCCEYVLLWLAACCFSSFSLCYFTYF